MSESVPAQRFLESDWDVCVVLDACRYDVFADVYAEYLDGDLEKRCSAGSSTPEWAYRTFTDRHDIAYLSSNPFINDLGIPLNELKWGASCDYEWTATEHISDVVDVWDHGWDDDLGTVPPAAMVDSYHAHGDRVTAADRTVVHYMQPHAPYLARESGGKLTRIRKGIREQGAAESDEDDEDGLLASLTDRVRPAVEGALDGSELAQKAGLWLELDPASLVRDGTRETAMNLYEQNLRLALESVADLVTDLEGEVVVTADHGEAFGEQGVWEHHIETHIPPLVEVPWLAVR